MRQLFRSSCGCKLGPKGNACSTQFTPEAVKEQQEKCATLEKEALDMLILGQFQAHSSGAESNKTNRQYYIAFHYRGKRICRNFFLFIHSISLKRYRNLLEHHHKHGAAQRVHGNKHKAPHNRLPLDAVQDVVAFIQRFAEIHAMPLPGRLPNHKEDKALLLPSSCGKSEVYRQYVHARSTESKCAVSWAKFHSLWKEILPHISTMKPTSDLCFECQNNAALILRSRLKAAEVHLNGAKGQRRHHNEQCQTAKREWEELGKEHMKVLCTKASIMPRMSASLLIRSSQALPILNLLGSVVFLVCLVSPSLFKSITLLMKGMTPEKGPMLP